MGHTRHVERTFTADHVDPALRVSFTLILHSLDDDDDDGTMGPAGISADWLPAAAAAVPATTTPVPAKYGY